LQRSPFQIYNASAGSGKTYQLSKNYLRLILAPKSNLKYRALLALTFTNKAVGEMKDRILQNLQDFSLEEIPKKSEPLFLELQDEFGCTKGELKLRAANTLKELLHNYGFFEISTIDKFNHKIVRTFARDLKIAQNFEVELDTESLLHEAVLRVLNKAGQDKVLTTTLINFSLEKIDDHKSWNIGYDLNQVGKILFNENHSAFLQDLQPKNIGDFNRLKKSIKDKILLLEGESVCLAKKVLDKIVELGFEYTDFPRETLPNHFKKIAAGETALRALYQNKIEGHILEKKILKATIARQESTLLPFITTHFFELKSMVHSIQAYKNAYGNILALSLINEIQKEVKKLQEERNVLAISDFNTIISKEVKNQPVPFIYERLGEKYRHFFIDEFQDTSKNQWANLTPLIGNALESMDEKGESGSLLLVGDVKQAIYRWRGGEASQFLNLSNGQANPFTIRPQINQLGKNWRSHNTIVDFNNGFFTYISNIFTKPDFHQLFIDGNKQDINGTLGGYVNVTFLEKKYNTKIHPQCLKTLETIQKITTLGHSFKDICILVRENSKGMLIANYLAEQGIPLISADVLLLKNSPEVQFLIALLRYFENPKERLYRFEILSYLSPEEGCFHDFIENHIEHLNSYLSDYHQFHQDNLLLLSTHDFLEFAIQRFDLAKTSNAYINYFMDAVLDYGNKESTAIFDFLVYWERKQDSLTISAPEHLEAVKIMTVHKSKGLEFPFVIFPFANNPIQGGPKKNDIWIPVDNREYQGFNHVLFKSSPELEFFSEDSNKLYLEEREKTILDSINVLYVALTRAIAGLFVLCDDEKGNKTTYGTLLRTFCIEQRQQQPDTLEFSFGNLTQKQEAVNIPVGTKPIPYIYSTRLQTERNPVRLAASLPSNSNRDALNKGNLIHALMANVHTAEDIKTAVDTMVNNGTILTTESQDYKQLAMQIVSHKKLSAYYAKSAISLNETEILDVDGAVIRPDRVVISNKNVVLIDYKTGAQSTSHKNQLRHYEEILSKMGYFVTNKVLVYINESITPIFI